MKTVLKITLSSLVALVFTACGSNTTSNTPSTDKGDLGTNERMIKNKTYTVNSGDEIEKISDNPQLEITSNLETGKTEVKLISGEAAIIKH